MSDKTIEEMKAAVLKLYPDATVASSGHAGKRIIYSPLAGRVNADENPYLSEWHWTGRVEQREAEAWTDAYFKLHTPEPQEAAPQREQHGMNCGAWFNTLGHEVNSEDCTCGLKWRTALGTEQTMHAAWRKRAEEAEAENAKLRAEIERKDKWISVEDEMPKLGKVVLFWKANQMNIGQYRKYLDVPDFRCFSGTPIDATHWRPRPAPPSERDTQEGR